MPEAHLVLDRLTARDGQRPVLDRLSLTLRRGETLALLGPEGAGKSAALLTVAGFLRPCLGTVRLEGRDITVTPPERRDVAMAFAEDALFPHLSVLDNVSFGLKMRGVARGVRRALAQATLDALGLAALATRHPGRLDSVERHLVALARAAACRPALLLVDEPSAAADSRRREAARAVLRAALAPDHTTAILATHDRAAAFGLAGQVALLRAGRLEQLGPPAELYERPSCRFAAEFTGGCTLLPATLLTQQGGVGRIAVAGIAAVAQCPPDMPPGPALLCLRPHRLRPEPQGPLRGTVTGLTYQGAATTLTLLAEGITITAELAAAPAGVAPGDQLALGWDAAGGWLLPVDPG